MAINKTAVKNLIIEGKADEAIALLLKLGDRYDKDLYNNSVMLSSRYNSLIKDQNLGITTAQQLEINRNRITLSLTNIVEKIPDSWIIQESGKESQGQKIKTILFLAANPTDTQPLRLDQELRQIEHGLERSKKRDSFKLVQKWAVQIPDLRQALLDNNPHIVHFSGHGSPSERIILEGPTGQGKEVPSKAIGGLFSLFKQSVNCVVLNACYSESQAQEIAKNIPFVIGMNTAIPDDAAIEFSSAFYDGIANGRNIDFAFDLARNAIELFHLPAGDIPVLIKQ